MALRGPLEGSDSAVRSRWLGQSPQPPWPLRTPTRSPVDSKLEHALGGGGRSPPPFAGVRPSLACTAPVAGRARPRSWTLRSPLSQKPQPASGRLEFRASLRSTRTSTRTRATGSFANPASKPLWLSDGSECARAAPGPAPQSTRRRRAFPAHWKTPAARRGERGRPAAGVPPRSPGPPACSAPRACPGNQHCPRPEQEHEPSHRQGPSVRFECRRSDLFGLARPTPDSAVSAATPARPRRRRARYPGTVA